VSRVSSRVSASIEISEKPGMVEPQNGGPTSALGLQELVHSIFWSVVLRATDFGLLTLSVFALSYCDLKHHM